MKIIATGEVACSYNMVDGPCIEQAISTVTLYTGEERLEPQTPVNERHLVPQSITREHVRDTPSEDWLSHLVDVL